MPRPDLSKVDVTPLVARALRARLAEEAEKRLQELFGGRQPEENQPKPGRAPRKKKQEQVPKRRDRIPAG